MRLSQLQRPLQAAASGATAAIYRPPVSLSWTAQHRPEVLRLLPAAFTAMADGASSGAAVQGRRWASVKSQGAYKLKMKGTIPKKLGAKRSGEQYVIPGNIIYKQRGTIWHPGENAIMGRDHTIHAAISGYVKYYRDPALHPNRQYIGVAHNRDDVLPYPAHAVRRRKLDLVAVPRKTYPERSAVSESGIPRVVVRRDDLFVTAAAKDAETTLEAAPEATTEEKKKKPQSRNARRAERARVRRASRVLLLRKDYSYRESMAAIGRLTGRAGGRTMGTAKFTSRSGLMRARRRRRSAELTRLTQIRAEKAVRVREMQEGQARKRAGVDVKAAAKKAKKGQKESA